MNRINTTVKRNTKKAKSSIRINIYVIIILIMTLFIGMGYAEISSILMDITGVTSSNTQDGVFITKVVNVGEHGSESKVNHYIASMLDSKVVLEDSSSIEKFEITVYNKNSADYVFIDILTDLENALLYDNPEIEMYLEGIQAGETIIKPEEYLTFTIAFKYKDGASMTNNTLNSKINFRFKQKPILELSNDGQTYELDGIGIGQEQEYEFIVSNYNQEYINEVPLTYRLQTELTEGSPLEAKIYDKNGNEITEDIELAVNLNKEEHAYKLKLTWDDNLDDTAYMGKEYKCNIKLIAKPNDADYLEYKVEKGFNVDITTLNIVPIYTVEQLLKMGSGEVITIDGKEYTFTPNASYKLQNDIEFEIADYIAQYPNSFEGGQTQKENEITNYDIANSNANQYYTYTAPATGTYKLQVWGAQGGYSNESSFGGYGGYSIGTITLDQGDKLYVYVGGQGGLGETPINGIVPGGYNGGGYRYGYTGGGGATDIRFTNGMWNDASSLLSRVIVAGGGGSEGSYQCFGGYGGGTEGESAWEGTSLYSECGMAGTASHSGYSTDYTIETQTTTGLNSDSLQNFAGGFGFGGGGTYLNGVYGGAGGGGWYGAAGVIPDNDTYILGGGGGSGYVWTEETAQYAPTGYSVGTEHYLIDAATYGGYRDKFESPTGEEVRGKEGDGYARITLITGLADSTKWINCEEQLDREILTGAFEYDGYTITVGDMVYPSIPTVTANVSEITTEKVKITANGNDQIGDELEYTLKLDGKTYGPSDVGEWTIDKLTHNKTYTYSIEVTDGHHKGETIGTFTTKELIITSETSDIKETSATITATTEADEENHRFTLQIDGRTYGPDIVNQWNIDSLKDYTIYPYTTTVTDGTNTVSCEGTFRTLCIHDFGKEAKPQSGKKYLETGTYHDGVDTAMIPGKFTASGVLGGYCKKCGKYRSDETTVETGLVIYLIDDMSVEEVAAINWNSDRIVDEIQRKYDQFVWIPIKNTNDDSVQDINDMYICQNKGVATYGSAKCNITVPEDTNVATCTVHGNCTVMAGRLNASTVGESFGLGVSETFTTSKEIREPDVVSTYDGKAQYLNQINSILQTNYTTAENLKSGMQTQYNDAVTSIYKYEGFYIGRYETSNLTTADGVAPKVVAGVTPTNTINWYYMYAQQSEYAQNRGLTTIGSSMIQGTAWDRVAMFVESADFSITTGGHVGHSTADFKVVPYLTGRRDYDTNYIGSVPYNDVQKNIFDLEGNTREWSLEARNANQRMIRGGEFSFNISTTARSYAYPDRALNVLGTRLMIFIEN